MIDWTLLKKRTQFEKSRHVTRSSRQEAQNFEVSR